MTSRRELANAIRFLSADAVQKSKSGHPGAPMGMADIAQVLWADFLKHNPADPNWMNRDRFILSNGHGSMLIYSLLHLSGYDLSVDDLRAFRQLHSKTPGHPEYGYTPGVETTTGPLGQGLANAVGMAIAEQTLAAQFNRPEHAIIDHKTYVFVGDGCLMEGISHEVASLAGRLGLGKLIVFYDDNNISIDGEVGGWFADDTPARFNAYGWQVIPKVDGHDPQALIAAVELAQAQSDKPTLICCQTTIGWGSPSKAGKESSHGAPLGDEDIAAMREALNWPHPAFSIPEEIYQQWDAKAAGMAAQKQWQTEFEAYRSAHPQLADELMRRINGELPENWQADSSAVVEAWQAADIKVASRKASQNAIEAFAPALPELLGGSADLAGSNLTLWSGAKGIQDDPAGNYVYYGVREFGMSAIMNGVQLHGGLRPYGGTFLMFSEYARNAVRMSALMKLPVIYVYTHDSIGLGEDGPTHQPVEQAATLRLLPRLSVWRPCDAVETAVAWKQAIERQDGPTALLLSRQNLAPQTRDAAQLANVARGGYILKEATGDVDLILIATGSEVALALDAATELEAQGRHVQVVSMPCCDVFDAQEASYRDSVLPPAVRARVAVEAGSTSGWSKYVGLDGAVLGLDTFGESAPAADVYRHFGITVEGLVERARSL